MVCKAKYTSLRSIIDEFQGIEDFFLILCGYKNPFPYPTIFLNNNSGSAKFYFQRSDRSFKEFYPHQWWLRFEDISGQFQTLIEAWRDKQNVLGPGIFMYLGTRRGLKSYVENDFGNMISGLESFHRTIIGNRGNNKIRNKIDRIIDQINLNRDKKWLSNKLKYAAEPKLEDRLIALFETLPLPINKERLKTFCINCADKRNGLFHFGTSHDQSSRGDFVQELNTINRALIKLYHFRILQEIGVSNELLCWVFESGFQSYIMKADLAKVGLLDDDPQGT